MQRDITLLGLSLEDISLLPADFSFIKSRKDVITHEEVANTMLPLPVISSNMTSVYSPKLSQEVAKHGGISIVHRFSSVEENVKLFETGIFIDEYNHGRNFSQYIPWVSVGSNPNELVRAEALVAKGAEVLVLDLAMGNSINAVEQYKRLVDRFPNVNIVVSDFCHKAQLDAFVYHAGSTPSAFTIGQGSGSSCRTRRTTGIGFPTASAIMDCAQDDKYNLILNGGIRDTDDFCKALALGCKAVIVGRLFAACEESGASKGRGTNISSYAIYRGSAAPSSYEDQGKEADFRAPEGEEYKIPITGTVKDLMNKFNGGLRSSMSYLNSKTLTEFRKNVKIVQSTNNGSRESGAYGKYE